MSSVEQQVSLWVTQATSNKRTGSGETRLATTLFGKDKYSSHHFSEHLACFLHPILFRQRNPPPLASSCSRLRLVARRHSHPTMASTSAKVSTLSL